MRELQVALEERTYPILIGSGLVSGHDALARLAAGRMVAVVTDDTVGPLYLAALRGALRPHAAALVEVVLPAGEASKT